MIREWLLRRRERKMRATIRAVWLPVIRMQADDRKCLLSQYVEENILEYIYSELKHGGRTPEEITQDIANHIRIGLEQPQCTIPYMIG